jgi:hypothetical protein
VSCCPLAVLAASRGIDVVADLRDWPLSPTTFVRYWRLVSYGWERGFSDGYAGEPAPHGERNPAAQGWFVGAALRGLLGEQRVRAKVGKRRAQDEGKLRVRRAVVLGANLDAAGEAYVANVVR